MIAEMIFDGRAMVTKGIVVAVNDAGAAQTVDVLTHDGAVFGGIEVIQPFGHATVPPADGLQALVLAIGGDPANRVAIVFNPALRFGGLSAGESVIYGSDGSRVGVRSGGIVEVLGMAQIVAQSPEIALSAPNGINITGPTTMTGDVSIVGNLHVSGLIYGALA